MSGFYPSVFVNIQKSRHCLCDWKDEHFNESEVWRNPCFTKNIRKNIHIMHFCLFLFRLTSKETIVLVLLEALIV